VPKQFVKSPLYSYVAQGAVFVFLLGLVDAGWSGDWSRIEAITVEQEAQCRSLAASIGTLHLVLSPTAAFVASTRGQDWRPAFAKTMLVGGLSFIEVCLRGDEQKAIL